MCICVLLWGEGENENKDNKFGFKQTGSIIQKIPQRCVWTTDIIWMKVIKQTEYTEKCNTIKYTNKKLDPIIELKILHIRKWSKNEQ